MGVWVRIDLGMDGWGSGQWAMEAVGSGGSPMGVWVRIDRGMDG